MSEETHAALIREIDRLKADLARVTGEKEEAWQNAIESIGDKINRALTKFGYEEQEGDEAENDVVRSIVALVEAEREKNSALQSENKKWEDYYHEGKKSPHDCEAERARAKGIWLEAAAGVRRFLVDDGEQMKLREAIAFWLQRQAALSPSPAKECRDCVGPGHDVCYEHPPAVEKPCCEAYRLHEQECPNHPPAVAPVESLTEDEGGK